jgi:alkylhydroperoxidase family enzyme
MLQHPTGKEQGASVRIEISPESNDSPLQYVASMYAPEMLTAAMAFSRATYEYSALSLREFEAARYRVAQINGCQLCQNWRSARDTAAYVQSLGGQGPTVATRDRTAPTEAFYAAIANWKTAGAFSSRERVAIEYAERMCEEPKILASDELFWKAAHAAFSDREIVDLSYCIACWMGLGRVAHVLGIDSACQIPALAEPARLTG